MNFFNPFHIQQKPKLEELEEEDGWGEDFEQDWTQLEGDVLEDGEMQDPRPKTWVLFGLGDERRSCGV